MRLKFIKNMIAYQNYVLMPVAVIAILCFIMNYRIPAIILVIGIAIYMVSYFVISLTLWRCPHCHQYLPLKNVNTLETCPHCHKELF